MNVFKKLLRFAVTNKARTMMLSANLSPTITTANGEQEIPDMGQVPEEYIQKIFETLFAAKADQLAKGRPAKAVMDAVGFGDIHIIAIPNNPARLKFFFPDAFEEFVAEWQNLKSPPPAVPLPPPPPAPPKAADSEQSPIMPPPPPVQLHADDSEPAAPLQDKDFQKPAELSELSFVPLSPEEQDQMDFVPPPPAAPPASIAPPEIAAELGTSDPFAMGIELSIVEEPAIKETEQAASAIDVSALPDLDSINIDLSSAPANEELAPLPPLPVAEPDPQPMDIAGGDLGLMPFDISAAASPEQAAVEPSPELAPIEEIQPADDLAQLQPIPEPPALPAQPQTTPTPLEVPTSLARPISVTSESEVVKSSGAVTAAVFNAILDNNASHAHMMQGDVIYLRQPQGLNRFDQLGLFDGAKVEMFLSEIFDESHAQAFAAGEQVTIVSQTDRGSFLIYAYKQRHGVSVLVEPLPAETPNLVELDLPKAVVNLLKIPRGLLLLSGPAGAGKRKTMCAMVNEMNLTLNKHIIVIGDKPATINQSNKCLVSHHLLGNESLAKKIRTCLQHDPNVLAIQNLDDPQSLTLALDAVDRGCLVIATCHANSYVRALKRLLCNHNEMQRSLARERLAEALKAVIYQGTIAKPNGERLAYYDFLLIEQMLATLIKDGDFEQLAKQMQSRSKNAGLAS